MPEIDFKETINIGVFSNTDVYIKPKICFGVIVNKL